MSYALIGSTYIHQAMIDALSDAMSIPIESWEDSLISNSDDYVYVDGEEGDFGILTYHGPDASGANVMMMVRYVHGGDIENTYYTKAGIDHVRNVVLAGILPVAFDSAWLKVLNPEKGESGLKLGVIKAAKEAEAQLAPSSGSS